MEKDKEMVVAENSGGGLVQTQMTTLELLNRKKAIQEIQSMVMTEGIDYGVIPGCAKPTLLKPGAETLNVTFGLRPILDPAIDIQEVDLMGGHKNFQVTVHILSAGGQEIATGVGSCSTMESKYRYRKAEQTCPKCDKPTIIKGKKEYGGGWICFAKKGGCGAKFPDGDPAIENQNMGRIEHDNPADYYNTCLKIAKKRALVDGTINATAVSHIFTQDIEEMDRSIIQNAEYTPATQVPKPEPEPITEPQPKPKEATTTTKKAEELKNPFVAECEECGEAIDSRVASFSQNKFGKKLCLKCQAKA